MAGSSINVTMRTNVFPWAGLARVARGGRRDDVDDGRGGAAGGPAGVRVLRHHLPRLHALLPAQGLPLRLQPLEVQHLRRAVLQRLRVQLPPAEQEPPMTDRRGAVRTRTLMTHSRTLRIVREHFKFPSHSFFSPSRSVLSRLDSVVSAAVGLKCFEYALR